ncbi:MAG: hypothetical protein ACLFPD_02810 [Desulfosudaceae bacterium]
MKVLAITILLAALVPVMAMVNQIVFTQFFAETYKTAATSLNGSGADLPGIHENETILASAGRKEPLPREICF